MKLRHTKLAKQRAQSSYAYLLSSTAIVLACGSDLCATLLAGRQLAAGADEVREGSHLLAVVASPALIRIRRVVGTPWRAALALSKAGCDWCTGGCEACR